MSRRARERQNARPWEPSSTTEAWLGGDGPDSELGDWSDGTGDEDEDDEQSAWKPITEVKA